MTHWAGRGIVPFLVLSGQVNIRTETRRANKFLTDWSNYALLIQ